MPAGSADRGPRRCRRRCGAGRGGRLNGVVPDSDGGAAGPARARRRRPAWPATSTAPTSSATGPSSPSSHDRCRCGSRGRGPGQRRRRADTHLGGAAGDRRVDGARSLPVLRPIRMPTGRHRARGGQRRGHRRRQPRVASAGAGRVRSARGRDHCSAAPDEPPSTAGSRSRRRRRRPRGHLPDRPSSAPWKESIETH